MVTRMQRIEGWNTDIYMYNQEGCNEGFLNDRTKKNNIYIYVYIYIYYIATNNDDHSEWQE